MAVFGSTDDMYEVLGNLWKELFKDKEWASKFRESNLTIKFTIDSPSGEIWLLPDKEESVVCGKVDRKPDIEMFLKGDDCHKFWMKELNLPLALATGKIKAKGPVNKILKFLPMLKSAYEMYPKIAREHKII